MWLCRVLPLWPQAMSCLRFCQSRGLRKVAGTKIRLARHENFSFLYRAGNYPRPLKLVPLSISHPPLSFPLSASLPHSLAPPTFLFSLPSILLFPLSESSSHSLAPPNLIQQCPATSPLFQRLLPRIFSIYLVCAVPVTQICFLAPPPFFTRLTQGSMPTAQNLEQSLSRPRHSKRSHHKLYPKTPTPSQSQADLSSYSQLRERATTVAVTESGCYGKRNLY